MEEGAKLAQLRSFVENPCFQHFIGVGENSTYHQSIGLVIQSPPGDIKSFFDREQTIGEARGIYSVHEKVMAELRRLELNANPDKKAEYERRNAVSSD